MKFLLYRENEFPVFLKHGKKDFFSKVEIETLTECNRKCYYCPNSKFDRGKHFMEESLFKKVIADLKKINFSGRLHPHFYGEPLLDPRLQDLMRHVKQELPNIKIYVFTNGDFLDKKMFDKLNPLVEEFVVTNHGKLNPDMPNYKKIKVKNMKKFTSRAGLVELPKNLLKKKPKKCFMSTRILTITYKGDIILCCHDYHSKHVYGNINDQSIKDIWNNPKFVNDRKMLRKGIPVCDMCKHC